MNTEGVDTALEQALERLALLAEASTALASTLDLQKALRRLCRVVLPRLGDWCAIDLLGDHGIVRRVVVAHHDTSLLPTGRLEGPLPPTPEDSFDPLARVLRGVGPLLLDEAALHTGRDDAFHTTQRELFEELRAHSVIIAPLRTRSQALGALTLARSTSRTPLTADDAALVEDLAHRIALAVDNSHLFASVQHVAERLQRSLLPPLPGNEPYAVAARYVPAPTAAEVGGDWYDYFPLPDDASALIIGDVVGHDVQAAVTMSQLRNMLRALACDRREPLATSCAASTSSRRPSTRGTSPAAYTHASKPPATAAGTCTSRTPDIRPHCSSNTTVTPATSTTHTASCWASTPLRAAPTVRRS